MNRDNPIAEMFYKLNGLGRLPEDKKQELKENGEVLWN